MEVLQLRQILQIQPYRMNHQEQINEFSKKLDELIDWFAQEFTEITYAALIGVLFMKIAELAKKD